MTNLIKAAVVAALFTILSGAIVAQGPIPPSCPPAGCKPGTAR